MPQGTNDGIVPSILRTTIKQILSGLLPGRKSSHLTETLAVGFGYANNAAYLADTKVDAACILLPVSDMASEAMALRLSSLCSTTWSDEMLLVSTALRTLSSIMPGRVVPVGPASSLLKSHVSRPTLEVSLTSPPPHGLDLRTSDGELFPHAPGGTEPTIPSIDLIYAPPGKGKSVLLNAAHMAIAGRNPENLPLIRIVDIGPSSKGAVSSIRRQLPEERRSDAQHIRIRMTNDCAANPFDTQLGCRRPLPTERASLVDLLTAIGTPPEDSVVPSGLQDIAGYVVDELYEMFSDYGHKCRPKRYLPTIEPDVDRAILELQLDIHPDATWWGVTDALFAQGMTSLAEVAQRHAVPLLEDIGSAIRTTRIKDIFSRALTQHGEPTIDVLKRMCFAALNDYPILRSPTRLEIGCGRVVAIDLEEVAPRGAGSAQKQTSLMYLWAMHLLARDFRMNRDALDQAIGGHPLVPELYRDHHADRSKSLRTVSKHLVLDEFHRTAGSQPVLHQTLIQIREGRKWGIAVAIASQLLSDFDKNMVDMASRIWVMGVGNERMAKETAELFGLSHASVEIMHRHLTGPGIDGTPILASVFTSAGRIEELVQLRLEADRIWETSTSHEDVHLRDELVEALGADEALKRLSSIFPKGSATKEIRRRQEHHLETDGRAPDMEAVVERIVAEMMAVPIR